MLMHYLALKTFQTKQAIFLIEQRKLEYKSRPERLSVLVDDLWSRRYATRRIPVRYEWLQREVAMKFYWRHRMWCSLTMKTPDFSIDEENYRWISCLHRAADVINDCIEFEYLECVGKQQCDLLQITLKGAEYGSFYRRTIGVLGDISIIAKTFTSSS